MSLCVRGYAELRSCCRTHFIVLQIRIVWKSQITLFLPLTLCGNQENLHSQATTVARARPSPAPHSLGTGVSTQRRCGSGGSDGIGCDQ